MRYAFFVLFLAMPSFAGMYFTTQNPTPPFIGYKDAPSAAQAVNVSSNTQLVSVYVPGPVTVTGVRINVGVQSGQCQVGLYDNTGALLASSAEAACPAAGAQTISFTSSVSIGAGIYYLAIGADNTTQTFAKSSGSGLIGCNFITANLPMAATVTLPGSSTGNCFAAVGIVSGGITQ